MVTITDDGLDQIAKLFNGISTLPFKYIALGGSNTTAESYTNTKLDNEFNSSGLERALADNISFVSPAKAKINHTFNASASFAVWEVGLFNESGTGNGSMYCRHVYSSAKNLNAGDSIEITFEITMSR